MSVTINRKGSNPMRPNAFWSRWLVAFVLVFVPVICGLVKWWHKPALVASLFALAGFWAVVLVFLEWAGRHDGNPNRSKYGFIDVLIGADGRVSTSKTVVYVWTYIFASALVILTSLAVFGYLEPRQAFHTGSNWDAYLLLLGGPFASAVLAKGVVSFQTQQDPASKSGTSAAAGTANAMSTSVAAKPSATDIVNGDSGSPSLVDTQYSIFSLIAILYFAGRFIANLDKWTAGKVSASHAHFLPQIPSALLGLTSLAALTYVGNKAVQTQGLRVVSFSPNPAPVSSRVQAAVVNLPATAAPANTVIRVTDAAGNLQLSGAAAVNTTNNTVDFQSPATPGTYSVTIAAPNTFTGAATLVVQ
jgi:hypothetical protein